MSKRFPPVNTKKDFVKRYAKGEFGNASPTWNDIEEWFQKINPDGLYHIRNRIAGGPTYYNVPRDKVFKVWNNLITSTNIDPSNLYISQMCPTEKTVIQGEVAYMNRELFTGSLDLTFTTIAKPMREAFKELTLHVNGLSAINLLKSYMCYRSYEWLQILLERYPDHVVEFSTFSTRWGTIPGYNTVFWEVRNY